MELTEVQKEADSSGRKATVFGILLIVAATTLGWLLAHFGSSGPETQPVVVAAVNVAPLTQLKPEQLKVVEWPVQSMPHGTFQKPEDVVRTGEININGVLAGEPILADRLSTPDRGLGMSQMVDPNMRAYVVRVDDHVATAEVLHPGAKIDVVVTLDDPKGHEPVTKVILQNITVLGVGDSIDVEAAAPRDKEKTGIDRENVECHRVVTLLVNASDVEALGFASRAGRIDLFLRNANDPTVALTRGITFEKIMARNRDKSEPGHPSADAAPAAAAAPVGNEAPVHHRHPRPPRAEGPSIIKVNR